MRICYEEKNFKPATEQVIDQAQGILAEYEDQGYTLTLRQLYYQFVARDLIPNTQRSYKRLGTIIADARMAGLISWQSIEDRTRSTTQWLIQEDERRALDGIEYGLALDFWKSQGVYVEAWVEKDALASVLRRPCNRWRVPYGACKGYMSASEIWRAGQRYRRMAAEGRSLYLIHLGDHDPSGIDMTRDNAHRLIMFSHGAAVDVRRVALNRDQINEYDPPPNPAKITDSRAAEYIARHGRVSWELDALEPRVIDEIVNDEIESMLTDPDAWDTIREEERERRKILAAVRTEWDDVRAFLEDRS